MTSPPKQDNSPGQKIKNINIINSKYTNANKYLNVSLLYTNEYIFFYIFLIYFSSLRRYLQFQCSSSLTSSCLTYYTRLSKIIFL